MVSVTALPGLSSMLCGEGPHWVEKDQSLLCVDIPGGYVFRYYSNSGRIQRLKLDDIGIGSFPSLIVPLQGSTEEFVIAVNTNLVLVKWKASDPDHVFRAPIKIWSGIGTDQIRFNDGKCDPHGRLWAGTMGIERPPGVIAADAGSLYRFDEELNSSLILEKITVSNGLAWSSDKTKFFFVDSFDYNVVVYDYDNLTGAICNKRILFDFPTKGLLNQFPDGMTIDTSDNLWIACFGGSQVIQVDTKTGELMRSIKIPSAQVTSCCFGDEDYSTLYVTSAINGASKDECDKLPTTGLVFKVTGLGVTGLPPHEYALNKNILQY